MLSQAAESISLIWRWSYEPTDFVVGDPVEVKIKGNDMYLKKSKGGDLKTYITRRERNAPDKKPINLCSTRHHTELDSFEFCATLPHSHRHSE